MKKIDYAESGTTDSDYPESRKAMWTSLDRVQVISSADVSAAAETAVRAVALVEQDLAVEVPDPLRSSELEQRIASLRPASRGIGKCWSPSCEPRNKSFASAKPAGPSRIMRGLRMCREQRAVRPSGYLQLSG